MTRPRMTPRSIDPIPSRPPGGAADGNAAPRRPVRGRAWRRLGVAIVLLPALVAAAFGAQEPGVAAAAPLGGAAYEVVGGVYGTAADGLIGEPTASGQLLRADDRLVALPGCTVSSCPWLPAGSGGGVAGGPQTSCAEADGLCWVELTSPATGACAVAPVLDLGPFFRADHWWAPTEERVYPLAQGVPAAEAAAVGTDLGFGPGRGDDGSDLGGRAEPPALSVAAGTWADLGLNVGEAAATLRVRVLWQAGIFHGEACGGGTGLPTENAIARADVGLVAAPADEEPVRVVPAGRRVAVTGPAREGFYPVTHGAVAGWVPGEALLFDRGDPAAVLSTTDAVNLRAGPSGSDGVLRELPAGTDLARTGPPVDGFVPVAFDGLVGWVAAAYVR